MPAAEPPSTVSTETPRGGKGLNPRGAPGTRRAREASTGPMAVSPIRALGGEGAMTSPSPVADRHSAGVDSIALRTRPRPRLRGAPFGMDHSPAIRAPAS
jgi:hypothetical protein